MNRGHRCRELCRLVRAGLKAGKAVPDMGLTSSQQTQAYQHVKKRHHPDWPWVAARRGPKAKS